MCDPSSAFTENRKINFKSLFPPCSFGGGAGEGKGAGWEEGVHTHLIVNAAFLYVASAGSLLQSPKSDRCQSSSNAWYQWKRGAIEKIDTPMSIYLSLVFIVPYGENYKFTVYQLCSEGNHNFNFPLFIKFWLFPVEDIRT